MSGYISSAGNPLSRLTAACLQDMGYVVNLNAAEPYKLPNLFALAEEGVLAPASFAFDEGMVLPIIPTVLPEDSI